MPLVMPRPVTLPPRGLMRCWSHVPGGQPILLGTHSGRHPGTVAAEVLASSAAHTVILLSPSGRHTAWVRPARSEAA